MIFYAKGKKYRPIKNSTREKLLKNGYKMIVWKNGDFETL